MLLQVPLGKGFRNQVLLSWSRWMYLLLSSTHGPLREDYSSWPLSILSLPQSSVIHLFGKYIYCVLFILLFWVVNDLLNCHTHGVCLCLPSVAVNSYRMWQYGMLSTSLYAHLHSVQGLWEVRTWHGNGLKRDLGRGTISYTFFKESNH